MVRVGVWLGVSVGGEGGVYEGVQLGGKWPRGSGVLVGPSTNNVGVGGSLSIRAAKPGLARASTVSAATNTVKLTRVAAPVVANRGFFRLVRRLQCGVRELGILGVYR